MVYCVVLMVYCVPLMVHFRLILKVGLFEALLAICPGN